MCRSLISIRIDSDNLPYNVVSWNVIMPCTKIVKQLVNDIFWQRYEIMQNNATYIWHNADIFKLNTLFQRFLFVLSYDK